MSGDWVLPLHSTERERVSSMIVQAVGGNFFFIDDSNNSACPVDNCEPSCVMTELVALAAVAVCAAD